jgi:hypothetical protein
LVHSFFTPARGDKEEKEKEEEEEEEEDSNYEERFLVK